MMKSQKQNEELELIKQLIKLIRELLDKLEHKKTGLSSEDLP
jgi:hypothetical protein